MLQGDSKSPFYLPTQNYPFLFCVLGLLIAFMKSMVSHSFKSLLCLIVASNFLGNFAFAQSNALVPVNPVTIYQEPKDFEPSAPRFEPPTSKEKWIRRGESFAIGTVGFMIGATMLQFMKAEYTQDPMLRDAAIDALADMGGWADLGVFSAASSVTNEVLQALVAKRSPELFKSATRQMAFSAFLHGSGMTVGSIAMHFFSKYRTSKERIDRMAQDREWGYWVGKREELHTQLRKLNMAVTAGTIKGQELEERKVKIAEVSKQLGVAKANIEKHRTLWKNYAAQSFQKIVDVDPKEGQQLVISTLQMLITTAIVPFIKMGISGALSASKTGVEWANKTVREKNGGGIIQHAQTFSDREIYHVKDRFNVEFAKVGADATKFNKDKFLKMMSLEIMTMRFKQQAFKRMTFNLAVIAETVDSLKTTEAEKTWSKGRAATHYTTESWKTEIADKISTSRKTLTWSKKAGGGLLAGAISAVLWLGTNENFTIPYYTKFGYEYSPLGSWGKYLGLYKLEDRIADAKRNLVDKSVKAIRNYKEPKVDRSYTEPDPITAMNGVPMTVNESVSEDKNGAPESYAAFLQAVQEFDEVFKKYRDEIVLRELNEHYNLYVAAVDKIQNEMYQGSRYLKWFARGAKKDDPDFIFNGSDNPELIKKYEHQIKEDPTSPLYGAQIGKPWHKDTAEFAGAYQDEYKEIYEKYNIAKAKSPAEILALADRVEKLGNENIEAETKQFDSFVNPMLNKVMPEGREYANPKVVAGPLEKNYELEFDEIKKVVQEVAVQSSPANAMGTLLAAMREVEKSKDDIYGTSFFNPGYKKASDELNKMAGKLNDEVIAGFEKYQNYERAEIIALQLHLMMDNIKATYNKLQKQKAAIIKLDTSKVKDFNMENLLANPYNKNGKAVDPSDVESDELSLE